MLRAFATLCLVLLTMTASPAQTGRGPRESTIGLPAVLDDVRLAGSELEARKMDDLAPATVRIIEAWPDGENQWRYKLEWRAFTPGEHDLLQLLRRKDGSSTGELAPLMVTGTKRRGQAHGTASHATGFNRRLPPDAVGARWCLVGGLGFDRASHALPTLASTSRAQHQLGGTLAAASRTRGAR